jgi:hypothetical protein
MLGMQGPRRTHDKIEAERQETNFAQTQKALCKAAADASLAEFKKNSRSNEAA